MNLIKLSLVVCAVVASFAGWANEPNKVGDFALLDHQGKFHQLSYFGDQAAVVIYIHGNESAVVSGDVSRMHALRDEFTEQGVVFFLLNAQMQDSREAIAQRASEEGYELPILVDESQLVAESLGVERLGEVLVIDPKSMTLIYNGNLANDEPLKNVLNAVVQGRTPNSNQAGNASASSPSSLGEPIKFVSRDMHRQKQVSYVEDIVPILQDNCVSCHHDGAIGSWSMTNHAMVQGWSSMMREVVMTRRMPPGQIDPHVGKPMVGIAGLSPDEQQRLIHWIDAGAPFDSGNLTDPLAALNHDNPRYSLGEPDLVFKVEPQSLPATGIVDYRYIPLQLNLDRDIWVKAIEFVPGDRKVLHHVIAYVSSPADKTVRGRQTGAARGDSVGGFAPGRQPDAFGDDAGRLIRKGSSLLLQMHYTTSGKPTVDETEVGIFIHEKPPAYVMAGGVSGQRRFMVPPHAKEYQIKGEQLIERDAYLYSMTPHMHFRGKYMRYRAIYPDGSSEILLSVPKYDFNWQFSYQLEEPALLPAGTRLVAEGAMDNSDRNPANPDPSKPVHFGLQTKHEMFFGFTTLRYVGDTPESLAGRSAAESTAAKDGVGR